MTRTVRRLPGIAIERVPARGSRTLPPMDVAAFVGIAATGPMQIPVPVEDYGGFVAVFGEPARLAWDADAGRYASAQLGPAVRAFFASGGRRAYVLRVAGPGAERTAHPVPGLYVGANGGPAPARLVARAYGSWSDTLSVGAALTSEPTVLTRIDNATNQVVLGVRAGLGVGVGDLLRVRAGSWVGYLPVAATQPAGAPDEEIVRIAPDRSLWQESQDDPAGALGAAAAQPLCPGDTVERLTLELRVHDTDGRSWVLRGLGLAPGHPRYLGDLPVDEEYYAAREPLCGPVPPLWAAVGSPRFPLAASNERAFYYPLQVSVTPKIFLPAAPGVLAALERDGLTDYVGVRFIDGDLSAIGVTALQATADYLRWQAPDPRPLCGMHAVLGLDEVTVVAVPDATQRAWRSAPPSPPPLPPPAQPEPPAPHCHPPPFADCAPPYLEPAPQLRLDIDSAALVQLGWTATPAGLRYRLQVTTDPHSWDGARDVYLGPELGRTYAGGVSAPRFYRVRAESDTGRSRWSNGLVVAPADTARHVVEPAADYSPDLLIAVHRSLLRMCAARGDLLAVLSVPEHYRTADAIAHANRLRTNADIAAPVPPLGFDEQRALGFGALYHPWVGTARNGPTSGVGWTTPDGAVTGIIARRALTRGAWVAPANEPLADVVALRRREPDTLLPALQAAQVNALRQTPGGFLCLAEDTLGTDVEVRPINVRRLVSLIRRLTAREGAQYVFEPNDPTFRRAVDRGFTEVLAFLFRLGAFAGRTPEQAYRVEVGDPPNTAQSIDRGLLVVELKFAPAQPLEFLTVRLLQTGEQGFTLEVS